MRLVEIRPSTVHNPPIMPILVLLVSCLVPFVCLIHYSLFLLLFLLFSSSFLLIFSYFFSFLLTNQEFHVRSSDPRLAALFFAERAQPWTIIVPATERPENMNIRGDVVLPNGSTKALKHFRLSGISRISL